MPILEILILGLGLAMDAFAVSIAAAASPRGLRRREGGLLALLFGVFQGGMTLLGWLIGVPVARTISALDHWVAFALLVLVGVRMLRSGLWPERHQAPDPRRWGTRLTLSVATSIDALAVGLGLALLDRPVGAAALGIGAVTFGLSGVGVLVGRRLGARFGDRMQIVGGIVLLAIGLRILIEHLVVAP